MISLQESLLNKTKIKQSTVHPYEWYEKSGKFDIMQLTEIKAGFKAGLTYEQIDLYADPKYDSSQMSQIHLALRNGVSEDKVKIMLNPKFTWGSMSIIRIAFEEGFSIEQVKVFADLKFNQDQMRSLYKLMKFAKLSVKQMEKVADPKYDSTTLDVFLFGYNKGLTEEQVSLCYNHRFNWTQMHEIIDAFRDGLTIDQVKTFAKPSISAKKMKKMVEELK